ncbi:DMT family transporter, partial [Rubrivirga sp.]|uniref:DMT family transporter n=1 Tax=Rubrivirga sp. TaxID=1885344 RepID=UPI003C76881E
MKWIIAALVAVAGAAAPLQSGLNAELRDKLAGPIEVGFFSSIITTVVLAIGFGVMVAVGKTDPSLASIRAVPWWLWTGGLLGAF